MFKSYCYITILPILHLKGGTMRKNKIFNKENKNHNNRLFKIEAIFFITIIFVREVTQKQRITSPPLSPL